MSRLRAFALGALVVGMLGTAGSREAYAQTIKLATLVPSGSTWDLTLKTMGGEWRESTAGRVNLRIYAGGVAGDDPDLVRKMRIGQLQAATLSVSGLTEIDPAFALFEIPMFFSGYDELFAVLDALEDELRRRLDENGFMLLHWGHAGWVRFFTSEPADTLEALRRLKIFVWAGDDRLTGLWRDHGFRPVPLAATDILTGLKTGMFQAMPATPIAALSLQWFRSAPYMLDLGLTPLLGATIITRSAWEKIPAADRPALLAAAERAGGTFRSEIPKQDAAAVVAMQERGLTVVPIVGSADEAAWRTAAVRFAADMREAFVPPDFYDRALGIRDRYRQRPR